MTENRLGKHRGKFCVISSRDGQRKRYSLGTDDLEIARVRLANFSAPDPINENEQGWIYVMRCESPDQFIKIGFATRVRDRFHQVSVSCPYLVTLVGAMRGSLADEKQILSKFRSARVRGEWFRPTPEVLRFIEGVPRYRNGPFEITTKPDDDLSPAIAQQHRALGTLGTLERER